MNPSKEAIEAACIVDNLSIGLTFRQLIENCLKAAYTIDVAPIEKRIDELEKQNEVYRRRADLLREMVYNPPLKPVL